MKRLSTICSLLAMVLMVSQVYAQSMPTDPIGGKPPAGSKASVKDLDYQVKYHRAFEAVLWSMPAVAIYGFHKAPVTLGGGANTILAWSKPAKPNTEVLTANNVTPYLVSQTDLSKGAVVVEIPAATDKASLYGQIVDHWQITIADVGPSGIDKGKGGKLLLTPPGYNDEVPKGYLEIKSPSYRVAFAFRSIKSATGTTDDAYAYSKTLKMYYLDDPKPTKFIDPSDKRFPTLPRYDETWFEDVYDIISLENAYPRDKVMMGMLASLGIEKGKPYKPDAKTKKAMRQAVIDAYYYMADRLVKPTDPNRRWWKTKHWYDGLFADQNRTFTWEMDDLIDLDTRADRYYLGTYYPKKASKLPATQYLFALADKDGNTLEAGKMYSFTMPAKVPVKQFWSLIIYDLETVAFIYSPEERAGLSSFDLPTMKKNIDGSVTLYFGPKAPKGLESNWIPTSGKKPLPIVRMYGGKEEFWDKSWEMPDVEVCSITEKKPVAVTWRNYTRAETDSYFKEYVAKGGFGKFFHAREVVPIDEQVVIAMNRDTMYSVGIFDLTTPVTITKPETGDRFQSFQIINEDQYTTEVVYKPGKYTFKQKDIGTRYVSVVVRTLVDSSDPADVKKVTQIQDQIKVSQSSPGKFEIPNWDQEGLKKLRDAFNVLAGTMKDSDGAFGNKDEVDPVKFLMGCAIGWGGNPVYAAKYLSKFPEGNDGKTAYTITLKDVPVDGFWSVSIYNKERFFEQNKYNSYSINSVTAKKNNDGSVTLHFGGDPKQPNFLYIMDGWNYIVRFYQPRKAIQDGTYKFPELQPVK